MDDQEWPTLLTVAEVADRLRVSKMTVYRMCHTRDIESIRIGKAYRIPEPVLLAYIREGGS